MPDPIRHPEKDWIPASAGMTVQGQLMRMLMKIGSPRSILIAFILFGLFPVISTADAETDRITPLQLKDRLDLSDVIILDVRVEEDWQGSESKIKGALRADPSKFDDWARKYAKDATLVLY